MTKKNNFFGNQGSAMLSPSAQNKAEDNKKETEFTPISLAGKRIVERGSVDDKVRSGAHKTYSTKKLAEEKFASAMGRFSQENDKISVPDMPQTKGRKFLPGNEALAEKMQEAESIGYDNYLKNKTENKKPDVKKIFLSDNTRDRIEGRIGSPETAFEITKKNGDDLSWVQRRITETGSSTWEEYLNTVTEDDAAEFNSEVLNGMGILSRSYALDIISASKKNKARSDLVSAQKELGGVDIEESYYVNLIAGQRATELKGVRPEDYVYRGYQRSDDDDEDFALYMGEIYDRAEAEALHRVYNDDEIDIAASNMYKNNGGWLQSVMSPMENGVARKALGLANRLGRLTDEETEKAVEIMTKESETDAINLDKTATAINRAREANWTDSVNNLRENPDFEEKSKLTNEDALEVSMKYDHGPKSDINAESELDEGRKFAAIALNIPSDDAKVLTDEEVASIIYIAHTMGEKDGQAYYKTLKDDVNARKMDEHVRKTEQFATAHPYLASAKEHTVDAVAAGAKNAMYAASDIIGGITGKEYTPIDINDERFFHDRDLQITQAITDEKIKNPAIRAAYNVGMSVAENAFRTISAAAVGGAIAGAPGAAAGAKLATVLMASNAYQSGVYDATKRGASKGAAMAYGLLSGGIELATEQIGIDNFIDILEKAVKHGSKSILWDIGKQMTAEGVEEFIAAVAEPIYDDMVLGEKSHFNLRVKELEASGMDHNSAREQAMSEQVAEVLTSTAAGVISGGIMAGGGVAIGSGVKAASDLSAANHELKRMSPHSKDKGKSITPLVGETDSTAVENVFGNNAGNIETSDTNSASSRLPMSDSTLREGNNAERMASTMKKGTDIVINRLSEGEWSEEHESIYNNAVSDLESTKARTEDESVKNEIQGEIDRIQKVRALQTAKTDDDVLRAHIPTAEVMTADEAVRIADAELRAINAAEPRGRAALSNEKQDWKETKKLADEKLADIRFVKTLADEGFHVKFFSAADAKAEDGTKVADGATIGTDIYININGVDPVKKTLGHEFVHVLKNTSPEAYADFAKVVKEQFDIRFSREVEADYESRYEGAYKSFDKDAMFEEFAADVAGDMFINTEYSQSLINAIMQGEEAVDVKKSKIKAIAEAVRSVIIKLTTAVRKMRGTYEAGKALQYINDAKAVHQALVKAYHEVGNKKTASRADGEVKFSATDGEEQSIKEQIRANLDVLNAMEPIVSISLRRMGNKTKAQIVSEVLQDIKSKGMVIDKQGFGVINLIEDDINRGLDYVNNDAEYSAYFAIHRALKRGIVIGEHIDHKNRNMRTVTIGAPIILDEQRCNVGITLKVIKGYRYKSLRVVLWDGSKVDTKKETKATTSRMTDVSIGESRDITLASKASLSQGEANVKGDNLSGEGVKFSFAGPRAETADMSALERAEMMERSGVSAEETLRETGWYRGVDGKWRFEISDEDAEFSRRGDLVFKKEHPDYARYRELFDIQEKYTLGLPGGRKLTAEESKEYSNLRKTWKDTFRENGKEGDGANVQNRLAAYFQHDKLYEAYPELRDVEVMFDENIRRSSFSLKTKKISLAERENVDKYKRSLIHEIQHWIQEKEGFANGSSEEYWEERYSKQFKSNKEHTKMLEQQRDELYSKANPLYEAIGFSDYFNELLSKLERGEITIEDYEKMTNEYVKEHSSELYELRKEILKVNSELEDMYRNRRTAEELYINTAGEIEARDASKRVNMTAEARRNSMPARGDENTVFADYSESNSDRVEDSKKTAKEAVDSGAVPYTAHEKKNWEKSNTIVVYENDEQFNKFVLDALNNQNTNKKMYFGKVRTDVSKMIFDKTGVDIDGYNIVLRASEIRKILLYSHGDVTKEATRGQEAITIEDLKKIPLVITSPDNVVLSDKLYEGKPLIYFEKLIDGKIFVATYVSRKHRDVTVQTMYKRKRSLATASDAKSPLSTSETLSSTASSIDTVSQGDADVKGDNLSRKVKFSMPVPKSEAQYEDRTYKLYKEMQASIEEKLGVKISDETVQAMQGLADSVARGDETKAKAWREKLRDSILKNDMIYYGEADASDDVLSQYFKGMRNSGSKVLVTKEDSQDLTARELSSIFGVGGWSRTEGLGVDVMYEELVNMGAQLAEADSVQDRLLAIKEAREKLRNKDKAPMLNIGNVTELIDQAERGAVGAISEVERAREEATQNNPSVSEADSSLYTREPVSQANVTATVARLNEMADAIDAETDDVQKVTLEDEYRAEQLRFFEWILPHFTKANERGVTGDFCFHTAAELDAERLEVADSQRAAREADDYMNANNMTRNMVMAAHLLSEGELTEGELGEKWRNAEDREKIRELSELYKKVTASPEKLKRRHKQLFNDVLKHLFYYSGQMREINHVNMQTDTPERIIDKICRINDLRDTGRHGVTGDKKDDYFILLSDKLKDILIRGKDANEARLKQAAKEYRQIVKDLGIKAGSEESALIQDYGEGRITELDIPFDKREKVVNAAKVMTEQVYKPLLEEANRRRFIEGKGEFVAPPLTLTESERRSFRYMLDNARWVQEHLAEVKAKIKTVGVAEAAKSFNLNEGIVQALADHGAQFTRYVKWSESRWIAKDRVPILQQAWNLVQRGKKYNPRSGKVEMDYFPHFEKDDAITELGNLFIVQLPTAINGLTESFRPNSKYNPYFNERTGNKTDSDAIFGADVYINAALQYIYHTSDITKARMAENHIREKYSKDSNNPYALSNFVLWLREWGNQMAGKQHSVDRMVQNLIGRRASKIWRKGMGNIGRNQISWNIRTPFSNFSVWTRGLAVIAQELASEGGSSGLSYVFGGWNEHISKSDFLYSRFYDNVDLSAKDASKPVLGNGFRTGARNAASNFINTVSNAGNRVSDAGFKLMGWSDKFTVTAMHKMLTGVYIAQGMSEEDAIRKADYEMKSQAASRDFGDAPLIFSSQTLRPLTMFQIEALNQLTYAKDVIAKVVKNPKTARYVVATLIGVALEAVLVSLFNDLMKKLTGSPVMLDAVGITLDSFESLANGADFDEVMHDVMEEIPIVNNIMKAAEGEMSEMIGIGAAVSIVNNIIAAANPNTEVNWSELLYNAGLLVNPFGGMAQGKKMVQALQLVHDGYSENSKGQVRYAVDGDARDIIVGLLFGKSAMPSVQEWWDSGYQSLNKNNSNAFKQVLDLYPVKPEEAFDMMMEFQQMCSVAKEKDESYSSYEWVTEELDKWGDGAWSNYDKYFISCLIDGREATIPQRMEWPEKIIAEMYIRTGDSGYLMQSAPETFDVKGTGIKTVYTMNEAQQELYQEKYQEILFREISAWEASKGFDGIWNEEQWKDNIEKSKTVARNAAAAYCAENGYYDSKHDEAILPETDTFESLKNNEKLTDEERFKYYLKKEAKDHIVYDEKYDAGWNVMRDTFMIEGDTAVLPAKKDTYFDENKKRYTLNDEQYAKFVEYYNEAFYEAVAGMGELTYEQRVNAIKKAKTKAHDVAKAKIMNEYKGEILVTDKK